jgi:transaldolase
MLDVVAGAPVSFEVFADEFDEMEAQALEIASWGDNVYVKIPITNTGGNTSVPLVGRLSAQKVKVNVTAMMTLDQVRHVAEALHAETPAVVSVFAGRIADTGVDPVPLMRKARGILESRPVAELLWASPRELLNIFHADEVGCHIITVTHDLLDKLKGVGKDLDQFSLETVKMFYNDASAAGYTIAN